MGRIAIIFVLNPVETHGTIFIIFHDENSNYYNLQVYIVFEN